MSRVIIDVMLLPKRRRQQLGYLSIVTTSIFIVFVMGNLNHDSLEKDSYSEKTHKDKSTTYKDQDETFVKNIKKAKEVNKEEKIILFWNNFWGDKTWEVGVGNEPFHRLQCKVKNCRITNDHREFSNSDAVLFHIEQLGPDPPTKLPHQRFVFFMLESPGWSQREEYSFTNWSPIFNWTMTYRLDSDIILYYGDIKRKQIQTTKRNNNQLKKNVKNRRSVAWISSNCGWLQSQRETYIRELEKYIQVDKYGRCGNLKCTKDWLGQEKHCMTIVNETYNFYLAFENSICQDYVTEKVFKILPLDVIPVVRGGATYSRHIPHQWYINTNDFPSPKKMAQYLQYLQNHPREYMKYIKGREKYDMKGYFGIKDISSWCTLCEKLNNPHEPAKYYPNINSWWNKQNCRAPTDVPPYLKYSSHTTRYRMLLV